MEVFYHKDVIADLDSIINVNSNIQRIKLDQVETKDFLEQVSQLHKAKALIIVNCGDDTNEYYYRGVLIQPYNLLLG